MHTRGGPSVSSDKSSQLPHEGNSMSKQTKVKATIALMALVSASAFGSSQLGYGNTKCSIYTMVQQDGGTLGSNIDSWTLGYLSGLNHAAAVDGKSDKLRRQQPDRIAAYIRAYCESKTDETVEQAVNSYWTSSIKE